MTNVINNLSGRWSTHGITTQWVDDAIIDYNSCASIKIGGITLTPDTLVKLLALLETIESLPSDNELKRHYYTTLAINTIEGKDET